MDVPSLDGVAFIDPRGSQVEIIQAVGRAIRKVRGVEVQKKGTIVIPVFIQDGDTVEDSIEESNFKPVWDVLKALRAHDEVLADALDSYRTDLGKRSGAKNRASLDKVVFDLPLSVGSEFSDALRTLVVEQSTESWDHAYGSLLAYRERFGDLLVPTAYKDENDFPLGTWVSWQRHKKGTLREDRIARLNEIGFIWRKYDEDWERGLSAYRVFVEEQRTPLVPQKYKTDEGFKLGLWSSNLRARKKTLDKEKLDELDSLGFVWDVLEFQWKQGVEALAKYFERFGNSAVPKSYRDADGYALGLWVNRTRHRKEDLAVDKIKELDAVNFVWSVYDSQREAGLQELRQHFMSGGSPVVARDFITDSGFNLGMWILSQRVQADTLPRSFVDELNDLGFIWNVRDYLWDLNYERLKTYVQQNGNALVEKGFVTPDEVKLGMWVSNVRATKSAQSRERLNRLDELGFIWDVKAYEWQRNYEALVEYKRQTGELHLSTKQRVGDLPLGYWLNKQCKSRATLSSDQIEKLENLGIKWSN